MATKTVTMDGAEQRVDGLGGLNALIVNNTTEPLYASAKAGVVPYADGVMEIKAGTTRGLPDTNGTVYLLGNGGRAELTGTSAGVNFNVPSSSSEGGGGVTREEVSEIVTDKIAEVVANAPEDFDTLKEISDWIDGHEDSAAAMNSEIKTNAADISQLQTEQETQNSNISTLQTEMEQKLNVGEVSNPNLLDNPDFKINQRGQSEYSGTSNKTYSVDRWYIRPATKLAVESDGVTITALDHKSLGNSGCVCLQPIAYDRSGFDKITMSFYVFEASDISHWCLYILNRYYPIQVGFNEITIDASVGAGWLCGIHENHGIVAGDYIRLGRCKLETGDHATPFIPPNPATELLKCQRYFNRYNIIPNGVYAFGYTVPAGFIKVPFVLPTKMRQTPSVAIDNIDRISFISGASVSSAPSTCSVFCHTNNIYTLRFTVDNAPSDSICILSADDNVYIDLSADL